MLSTTNKCGVSVKMLPGETRQEYLLRWQREYRKANSKKLAEYAAQRRKANPEKHKQSMRRYYEKHRKELLAKSKKYMQENRERMSEYMANYRVKNKEKIKQLNKEWILKNKEAHRAQQRAYLNNRLKTDHEFRLKHYLKSRVREAIHGAGTQKAAKTMELLGCSMLDFRAHLQSQFTPEMTWDNYGSYWHVDHKRPLASFDLTNPEEQKAAFHYTNCQPLEGSENIRKGAKLVYS